MYQKTIKALKLIDVIGQISVCAIGVCLIYTHYNIEATILDGGYDSIILLEMLSGCWQIVSALIHLIFYRKSEYYKWRKMHLIASMLLCAIPIFSLLTFGDVYVFKLMLYSLLVPFFLSPILAIIYLIISIKELRRYS